MRKDELGFSEYVLLTGFRLGLSITDPTLMGETDWADDDAPRRYRSQSQAYSGWAKVNRLYCLKCAFGIEGITREIVVANKCPSCGVNFFDPDDTNRMDAWGYELYRGVVGRYTAISVRHFPKLIRQVEGGFSMGGVSPGFNVDHIHSVRHGFELDISPDVIACPCNLQVLPASKNFSKSSRSDLGKDELSSLHASFIAQNPRWRDLLTRSDEEDRRLSERRSSINQ